MREENLIKYIEGLNKARTSSAASFFLNDFNSMEQTGTQYKYPDYLNAVVSINSKMTALEERMKSLSEKCDSLEAKVEKLKDINKEDLKYKKQFYKTNQMFYRVIVFLFCLLASVMVYFNTNVASRIYNAAAGNNVVFIILFVAFQSSPFAFAAWIFSRLFSVKVKNFDDDKTEK